MITKAPTNAPAEVTAIDKTVSCSLLPLLGGSLVWLVVSGVLALINSIQLTTPTFLAHCPVFTFGRLHAMQETAFVYGWAIAAGLGLALWILGRLGGELVRGNNWLLIGTAFWNVGVLLALVGIAMGDSAGFRFLAFPGYVQLLLGAAYCAIALGGVLAWTGRSKDMTYAAQWYAFAALFLFPWLLAGAQAALVSAPFRGVSQSISASWYAQGLFSFVLAPLALAGAYYVIPKITGRVLPSYQFSNLGFWALIFIGAWTGGREFSGGPVPAWVPSLAIVATFLLLCHYIVVLLNLRGAWGGGGTALKFIGFGLAAYLLGGLLDAVLSMRDVAVHYQFTFVTQAQQQLALYGAISMILFGTLYFALPRLTGRAWASGGLLKAHLWLSILGVILLVASLVAAGTTQSADLMNAKVSFAEIAAHTQGALLGVIAAQALLLLGNLALLVNFLQSICPSKSATEPSPFRQPSTMEAHAS